MTHYEERLERDLAKLAKRVRRMGDAVVGAVERADRVLLAPNTAGGVVAGAAPYRVQHLEPNPAVVGVLRRIGQRQRIFTLSRVLTAVAV